MSTVFDLGQLYSIHDLIRKIMRDFMSYLLLLLLGSGSVADDDLWLHHIGDFSPFSSFPSVCPSVPPPPEGLQAESEVLSANLRPSQLALRPF